MDTFIKDLFTVTTTKDIYTVIVTLVALFFILRAMYNNIKFICLKKASEKIASVEELADLTGDEKFALVLSWINSDLPKIFNNAAAQTIIEKLVNFAYNNAFKYAQNYIQRKTGYDISELVNMIKKAEDQVKNDASTENKEEQITIVLGV